MFAINNSVVILGARLSNKAYQEKGKYYDYINRSSSTRSRSKRTMD